MIAELDQRSREIFRHIVETYMETGEPVGSRTLSRQLGHSLSPATIRNVMADLEESGLLYAPHTSAGRLPTDRGLRFFVDGLLEVGRLSAAERASIEGQCAAEGKSLEQALGQASSLLSGLSRCASLVLAPKTSTPLRQLEFLQLAPGRALAVIVGESGVVENRVVEIPGDLPASALIEAGNYLTHKLRGRTLEEVADEIHREIADNRAQLDLLTARVVQTGLATWSGGEKERSLIVRGQAHLLEDVTALGDLERIRMLLESLETQEQVLRLTELAQEAQGVQIFIGAENRMFALSGSAMIIAPYQNSREQIVGAIGVIGPTRINYARIIPLVDYTAKVIGRMVG